MPEAPKSTEEWIALVERLAAEAGLPLLPGERAGVAETYATLHAIAQALLGFPLPEELESAEVFQP